MSVAVRPLTLADAVLPRTGVLKNVALVVLASLLTAAAAQPEFRLPWTPVPITAQTFMVLLTGAVLGPRRGFLAMSIYLIEGACGLPFFAGGAGGAARLIGPSGGYLVAFPFAALVTGLLAERAWDRRPITMFFAMLLGSVVIFALGLAQLSRFVAPGALIGAGLAPFIAGDIVKAALAAIVFPAAWKLVGGPEAR